MNSLPRADTTDRIYEAEFLTTTLSSCLLPTFFLLSVILIDYFSGNSTAEKKKHPCEKENKFWEKSLKNSLWNKTNLSRDISWNILFLMAHIRHPQKQKYF